MTLRNRLRTQLFEALNSAFDYASLKIMLSLQMDVKIEDVSLAKNLQSVIFDLIDWAEKNGRVDELVTKAHADRPGNPDLAAAFNGIVSQQPAADEIPLPVSLPAPPPDFTGRAKELKDLQAHLIPGQAALAGLFGLPGAGKTVLALKLAQMLRPASLNVQILVALRGSRKGEALTPQRAIEQVIHSFQPARKLPIDETALRGLYLNILKDYTGLLLLDDASGAAQVEPLLPPEGWLTLITARNHFTLPGMASISLRVLPRRQAAALLRKISPRISNEDALQLADLLGCLPQSLRLVGSLLSVREDQTPAGIIERLQNPQHPLKELEEVKASLRLSYDMLSPTGQEALRGLSVFEADFDLPACADVWDTDRFNADERMGELVRASLVEYKTEQRRYWLPTPVAGLALSLASPQELAAARLRHARTYLHALEQADREFQQGGDVMTAGLTRFNREWPNIRQAQAWAARASRDEDDPARLCIQFMIAGGELLDLRVHASQRVAWLQTALAAARRLGSRSEEAHLLRSLGHVLLDLGEAQRAVDILQQALVIDRDTTSLPGEARTLTYLGTAWLQLDDPHQAVQLLQKGLEIDRGLGSLRGEADQLGNMGAAFLRMGDLTQARECFEQSLELERRTGERRGEAVVLGFLGDVAVQQGDLDAALKLYRQQLNISAAIGDERRQISALAGLGQIYTRLNRKLQAVRAYNRRVALARAFSDRQTEIAALEDLSRYFTAQGALRRAAEMLRQALAANRPVGDTKAQFRLLRGLGETYLNLQEPEKALIQFRSWQADALQVADRKEEAAAFAALARAYTAAGELRQAAGCRRQQVTLLRETTSAPALVEALDALAQALQRTGELSAALEALREALNSAETAGLDSTGLRTRLAQWEAANHPS